MGRGKVEMLLLILLVLWTTESVVEGYTCKNLHFQTRYCKADVVFRAEILEMNEITHPRHQRNQYRINLIETFKGSDKLDDLQHIYTPPSTSLRAFSLEVGNKKQYLLSGNIQKEGYVDVELCEIIVSWSDLSSYQIENLKYRYQNACECSVSTCHNLPCSTSANECEWAGRSILLYHAPEQVCIPGDNDTCSWYVNEPVPEGGEESPKNTSCLQEKVEDEGGVEKNSMEKHGLERKDGKECGTDKVPVVEKHDGETSIVNEHDAERHRVEDPSLEKKGLEEHGV